MLDSLLRAVAVMPLYTLLIPLDLLLTPLFVIERLGEMVCV